MSTMIRPELSIKNKYHIDKHRHYELKHFCLQYSQWKKRYQDISETVRTSKFNQTPVSGSPGDPTCTIALKKAYYSKRIDLIEQIAKNVDEDLYLYILKAVTEDLSYTYLKNKLDIPCSRSTYYDRYRRFFWLLSEARD